ncbi:MAG: hypothetical protein UV79_C0009G0006 [candidate division TM6 bacterium GW2011_GWF2_43_17]|nr:MAG: hypothetical protein UV79_C0009G0006 [candidate division TM6 bacterium GW2011_GWF2_43_17]HAU30395.1 hypothetical protein [Candidatus Dependentiae bacterium]
MEVLRILEEKIAQLIQKKREDAEQISQLKAQVSLLEDEQERFLQEKQKLEETLLLRSNKDAELDEEREIARMAVDELIQNIDSVLEQELAQ